MKNLALIVLFMFATNYIFAQNLVPNPSFEDTVYCPSTTNDIGAATDWFNFGNSPDYYNACAPSGVNVPDAFAGYQYAHSGNAMTGMLTQLTNSASSGANYREYEGTQLISPMIVSQKYYFSFFINYSGYLNGFRQIAANKIGLKFTTFPYSEFNPPVTDNFAHLYTDSIFTDTVGWLKITGSFIADSTYQYVTLGNFFDSINTDTMDLGGVMFGSAGAYYFIDDVCVTLDSTYNYNWTTAIFQNIVEENLNIYPNPLKDDFVIVEGFKNQKINISIKNTFGQIVKTDYLLSKNNRIRIDLSGLKSGLYIIDFENKNIKSKKILITN